MTKPQVHLRLASRDPGAWQRAPGLEQLLRQASAPVRTGDWRRDAFAVIAGAAAVPPVAAAAAAAPPVTCAASDQWVCIASPVHLVAGMSDVTLSADGMLRLDTGEAAALAADFNRVFGDSGARLAVGRNALLLCAFDRMLEADTRDPADVAGRDVFGSQPVGPDAARLRRLMSEMELWLFEHAVNTARAARGLAVITGLWLWGGGATLAALPEVRGWTAGTDPLFAAFGDSPAFPRTVEARAGRARAEAVRAGVLVCDAVPGSTQWRVFEQRWLPPLSAALRDGELGRLTVSVADRSVSVGPGARWRVWRRARSWWESFDLRAELSGGAG